jgi:transcriptional regulator with XRE-family HTH domain
LDWSQEKLAKKARISLNTVARAERNEVETSAGAIDAIHNALTKAGIEFLPSDDGGEGARLRSRSFDEGVRFRRSSSQSIHA